MDYLGIYCIRNQTTSNIGFDGYRLIAKYRMDVVSNDQSQLLGYNQHPRLDHEHLLGPTKGLFSKALKRYCQKWTRQADDSTEKGHYA